MRLDAIVAHLRPRSPWEGIDLGFALARHWFAPLWILWWITALPVALLLAVLTGARPDLWLVAVWWCKPLYEAPLQVWAGRALLGERMALAAIPGVLRAGLTRELLPLLLWRRPGLRRAFLMPVLLLEGLRGRAARRRYAILNATSAAPTWLTLVCYHFEAILWGGMLLLMVFLVPDGLPRLDLSAAVTDADSWPYWISGAAYLSAFSIIAPFYVCAGFSLYLTRRTELEAWDLEIAFRGARDEQASAGRGSAGLTLVGLLSVGLVLALPIPTSSAEVVPRPDAALAPVLDADAAQILIREILADEDFARTQEVTLWLPIERDPAAPIEGWTWPVDLGGPAVVLAEVLKWSLLVLGLAALVWLPLRVIQGDLWGRRRRRDSRRRWRAEAQGTETLIGRLGTAPLPDDLPATVRRLIDREEHRAALALLYRASLGELARKGVAIPEGATEGDCLALAAQALPTPRVALMTRLTGCWSRAAYAHRQPSRAELMALLDDWCRARDLPTGPTREAEVPHDA
jgi:hypothetical protein